MAYPRNDFAGGAVSNGWPAVAVRNLVVRYPKRPENAVDGLSFTVRPGETFGLLGPNGAGKTTTIGVLTTRIRSTGGSAWVVGVNVALDPVKARARLAVVSQSNNLDRSLTARQNLEFHAAYHGVPKAERKARANELLDQFGLADRANDKVHWYSGGMAQRLMIARALMHEPQVLFLDEPTTGLDPQARLFLWDRVRDLRRRGVSVVLTTHDMDEAAELSDTVGIIDHGRLLALDAPSALTRGLSGQSVLDVTVVAAPGDNDNLVAALSYLHGVQRVERVVATPAFPAFGQFAGAGGFGGGGRFGGFRGGGGGGGGGFNGAGVGGATGGPPGWPAAGSGPDDREMRLRLYLIVDAAALLPWLIDALVARHATLSNVSIRQPSIEDVFIHLTGRGLR